MDATRPVPDRSSHDPPPVVVRSGGRVRAALRCPYCHDQVERQDMLACARKGCGALYHRECWEECARWDGCAALACGGREAREVSALGYVVRWLRLLLAALLFPRRVVRALTASEGAGAVSIFRQAFERAWVVVPSRDPSKNGVLKLVVHIVVFWPAFAAGFALLARLGLELQSWQAVVAGPVVFVVALYFAPFLLALAGITGFYALRALALAFGGELAAFRRQDAPPARAARSAPKKDSGPPAG